MREDDLPRMTLAEHLRELRARVLRSVLALGVAFALAFTFWEEVWRFAQVPFTEAARRQGTLDAKLQAIDPGEGFLQVMKLCFLTAIVTASPVVLWQLWGFVSAGLYAHEKRAVRVFFPVSVALFFFGVVAAYLLLVPLALSFLMGFDRQMTNVVAGFRIESYLSLCITMVLAMGLAFEMPLVMLFLQATDLVRRRTFRKGWRYAVVTVFAISMVLTPDPSPVSMVTMAMPLVGLYFLGIWGGRFVGPERERFRLWKAWPLLLGLVVFVALIANADRLAAWVARSVADGTEGID